MDAISGSPVGFYEKALRTSRCLNGMLTMRMSMMLHEFLILLPFSYISRCLWGCQSITNVHKWGVYCIVAYLRSLADQRVLNNLQRLNLRPCLLLSCDCPVIFFSLFICLPPDTLIELYRELWLDFNIAYEERHHPMLKC
jgi:hypothetical protein